MEPLTLLTAALVFAKPYLEKTGEKLVQNIGEEVWKCLKKPFTNKKATDQLTEIEISKKMELQKDWILNEISTDSVFKNELQKAVESAQNKMSQQNIHNNGTIEKQINIQENNGNIQM